MIAILPLRYNDQGQCLNPRLEALAQEFCEREFGRIDFAPYKQALFCVVKGGQGEIAQVIGIMGLTFTLDLSLFHADSRNSSKIEAAAVSGRMIRRLHEYLLDRGFEGKELLIHIEPKAEPLWKGFIESHDAQPAERFILRVKPEIEL